MLKLIQFGLLFCYFSFLSLSLTLCVYVYHSFPFGLVTLCSGSASEDNERVRKESSLAFAKRIRFGAEQKHFKYK